MTKTAKPASGPAAPAPEPTPTPANQPKPIRGHSHSTFARHVWVGRKLYRVRGTFQPLEDVVFKVLKGAESPNGDVVFNGKRYGCDSKLFEGIIIHCLYAWHEGESDPVLDDGSGIPVELRIAS